MAILFEYPKAKPAKKPVANVANSKPDVVANSANGVWITCPHCSKEIAVEPKRDRKVYMRELMRKKRAKEKA